MMARTCAYCGRFGGLAFRVLIKEAEKQEIVLKYRYDRDGSRNDYMHTNCARAVQRFARYKEVESRVKQGLISGKIPAKNPL